MKVVALSMVFLLAACEAAFDEPRDAPGVQPVESVVGRWRQAKPRFDLEFRADGTYHGTIGNGTYSTDNGSLTMDGLRHPYVIELDHLITDPFLPANSNIGLTGRWTQSAQRDDGARDTGVIELSADGTATYTTTDRIHVGSWRLSGNDLAITTTIDSQSVDLHWRLLGMRALGAQLYERVK